MGISFRGTQIYLRLEAGKLEGKHVNELGLIEKMPEPSALPYLLIDGRDTLKILKYLKTFFSIA
jgi:hypothetical protein